MIRSVRNPDADADTQWGPTIPACFERQAASRALQVAVKCDSREITYAELNATANQFARAVLARTSDAPQQVALLYDQGAGALAAMLGVLKAGKTYVPIDPSYPPVRTTYMLQDSQASLILTDQAHRDLAEELAQGRLCVLSSEELDPALPVDNLATAVSPEARAYILYTSGSTGQPKGVVQTHRNLLHFVRSYSRNLRITNEDRLTLFYSFSFSASLMDIYGALLNGATLLPYDVKRKGLADLADWLVREEITVYHSVPTVFRHLLASLPRGVCIPKIRTVDLGGEPVYRQDVDQFKTHFSPHCTLVNHLAFTEASVAAQCLIGPETTIDGPRAPIGVDADGVQILLLDEDGREVGPGEVGEITLQSRFLSPGYWRKPDLTHATFLPCPDSSGERHYRSGDLGRRLPDGQLEHLGRKDSRVKVRGHSIETAEIEQALLSLETIREAVVVAIDDSHGHQCLVAYVVASGTSPPSSAALRRSLVPLVPDYMIPTSFVTLASLPLTDTGKVDRRALPAPGEAIHSMDATFRAPRTPTEQALEEIWRSVLERKAIGRNDNFFDLGGDSLRAFQMLLELERTLGVRLPPSVLLEAPTLELLAAEVTAGNAGRRDQSCLVALEPGGTLPAFYCVPPAGRTVLIFRDLARRLGNAQPFYALQHLGMEGQHSPHRRVETMAAHYVDAIRATQPQGPYSLGGMCFGGFVALEMARQLQAAGETVSLLAILDTLVPPGTWRRRLHYLRQVNLGALVKNELTRWGLWQTFWGSSLARVKSAHREAALNYLQEKYDGPITIFWTTQHQRDPEHRTAWSEMSTQVPEFVTIPGEHARINSFIHEPHVAVLAEKLAHALAQANRPAIAAHPLDHRIFEKIPA